jgi:hypothetical protein
MLPLRSSVVEHYRASVSHLNRTLDGIKSSRFVSIYGVLMGVWSLIVTSTPERAGEQIFEELNEAVTDAHMAKVGSAASRAYN